MNIIGISGRFCSGKTTLAEGLARIDPRYVIKGQADLLKQRVATITGVEVDYIEANKEIFRPLLQAYGMVMRQLRGEDFWVNELLAQSENRSVTHLIVHDVRFPNEARRMAEHASKTGGKFFLVRLEASDALVVGRYCLKYGVVPPADYLTHISETAWTVEGGNREENAFVPDLRIGANLDPSVIARHVIQRMGELEFDFQLGGDPVAEKLAAYRETHPIRTVELPIKVIAPAMLRGDTNGSQEA